MVVLLLWLLLLPVDWSTGAYAAVPGTGDVSAQSDGTTQPPPN
jgi:hypothetical protein